MVKLSVLTLMSLGLLAMGIQADMSCNNAQDCESINGRPVGRKLVCTPSMKLFTYDFGKFRARENSMLTWIRTNAMSYCRRALV